MYSDLKHHSKHNFYINESSDANSRMMLLYCYV